MNLLRILVLSSVFASISFAGAAEGSACCTVKKEAAPATCPASGKCEGKVADAAKCAEKCAEKCCAEKTAKKAAAKTGDCCTVKAGEKTEEKKS